MNESEKDEIRSITRVLRDVADAIEEKGFPTEPFIGAADPNDGDLQCFFVLWRQHTENRGTVKIAVRPEP